MKEWGVISYDWSNNAETWHNDHPNDCDQKMIDQAAAASAVKHTGSTNPWTCLEDTDVVWCCGGRCFLSLFPLHDCSNAMLTS